MALAIMVGLGVFQKGVRSDRQDRRVQSAAQAIRNAPNADAVVAAVRSHQADGMYDAERIVPCLVDWESQHPSAPTTERRQVLLLALECSTDPGVARRYTTATQAPLLAERDRVTKRLAQVDAR